LLRLLDLDDDLSCHFGDLVLVRLPSCLPCLSFDEALFGDRLPDFFDVSLGLSFNPSRLGDLDLERLLGDLDFLSLSFLFVSTLDESLSWSADLSFSELLLFKLESFLDFNSVLLVS